MGRRLVLIAALGVGAAPSAHAQQGTAPPCLDSATTQRAMTRCAGQALEAATRRQRQLLAELRDGLDAAGRAQLDSSETAWTAYAAPQCRLESRAFLQGSLYALQMGGCRRRRIEARIGELAPLLCAPSPDGSRACPAAERYLGRPARRGRRR